MKLVYFEITRRAAILCAATFVASSFAQSTEEAVRTYPSKPIKLIVPYAVGGGTDVLARMAAKEITERLGQPVVVENKPGVAAITGTEFVARSPADGYTLLMAPSGPLVMNPVLRKTLPYNPAKGFLANHRGWPPSATNHRQLFTTRSFCQGTDRLR